ncbi:MAG: GyrI-like domain-containing protein [Actinobacteria bacterium]|nr:GyrI-like domain-containing protein [Actinomycetota bacterium]
MDPSVPAVIERPSQPYVFIPRTVTMASLPAAADEIPGLFGWLAAHRAAPAGAPFLKYNVIDMERELQVEAGVPVAAPVAGDGRVQAGVLPGGRYAAVTHVGPYDQLVPAVAALLDWAAGAGLTWDKQDTAGGQRWGGRLEVYETNPAEQPDPAKWETRLVFRLAG